MRNAATNVVYELIKKDFSVIAVTADNRNDIYDKIRREYPKQYIDYGIAEENMIASAAGMASCGKIPFLYTITNFMSMHAYEFICNDVCVANQNVKFLGRSAGLTSSSMGITHQGTEELALLRTLPNMLVITPASPIEAREATRFAYTYKGPVYIRLEGLNEQEIYTDTYQFEIGKGYVVRSGENATIIKNGSIINEALIAADILSTQGFSLQVINMPMVKPIDRKVLQKAINTGYIITLEEHSIYGGLGTAVAEELVEQHSNAKFTRMGLDCCAKGCGSRKEIRSANGIAADDIIKLLKYMCR